MFRVCTPAAVAIALGCALLKSTGITPRSAVRSDLDLVTIAAVAAPRTWHVAPKC